MLTKNINKGNDDIVLDTTSISSTTYMPYEMSDEIYKVVDDDITLIPQRLNLSRYAPVDAGYFPECYYLKFNLKND